MTESTVAAPRASAFEDYIDIFYNPSAVFARRRDASPWVPLLIITGLFAIATYISYSLLEPVYQAEFARQAAKSGQQMNAEQVRAMQGFAGIMVIVGGITAVPLTVLILGLLLWLVGKLVDADQPLRSAFTVVAFSFMPRLVEAILYSLQAFVLDVHSLGSMAAASLSPARFMGPESPEALLAVAMRLGPFVIWSYVLIAIGLRVTGRVSMAKAAVVAFVLWLLGALPTAMQTMAGG